VASDREVTDRCGLSYEVLEGVGLIRIDRPDKLGAFTWMMIDRWAEALVSAQRDDAVRAVVVTGTGRGFCTGADLDELAAVGRDPIDQKRMLTDRVHRVVRAAADLDKPLICAVNGLAVGAGMDMTLLCDLRTSLDLTSSHLAVVQSTQDHAEALSALREHREPVFKGH
jgi:enoyl-CoA hydratase/carnithine racemase